LFLNNGDFIYLSSSIDKYPTDEIEMADSMTYDTRHRFLDRNLLDDAGKKVYDRMRQGDYPLVVRYIFRKD